MDSDDPSGLPQQPPASPRTLPSPEGPGVGEGTPRTGVLPGGDRGGPRAGPACSLGAPRSAARAPAQQGRAHRPGRPAAAPKGRAGPLAGLASPRPSAPRPAGPPALRPGPQPSPRPNCLPRSSPSAPKGRRTWAAASSLPSKVKSSKSGLRQRL